MHSLKVKLALLNLSNNPLKTNFRFANLFSSGNILVVFIAILLSVQVQAQTTNQLFIIKVKTNNTGTSNNTSFTLPMFGYQYDVDWTYNGSSFDASGGPDSDLNQSAAKTHNYGSTGTYTIAVRPQGSTNGTGTIQIAFSGGGDASKLVEIVEWGVAKWPHMVGSFMGCDNLVSMKNSAGTPDLSIATRVESMFRGCTKFAPESNIGNWNVSTIENMSLMFYECDAFNQNLTNWNVGKVKDFSHMFDGCIVFNGSLSGWNIGQNIGASDTITMSSMFYGAIAFNQPLNSWETNANSSLSQVNTLAHMFRDATSFNQSLGSWNVGRVESFESMFNGATAFNGVIQNWNIGVLSNGTVVGDSINMESMFAFTSFNQPLNNWERSTPGNQSSLQYVTNMSSMFRTNAVFNQNIGNWDVGRVRTFYLMFYQATSFNNGGSGDINNWEIGKNRAANDVSLYGTFASTNFNQDISGWNVTKVNTMRSMFHSTSSFNQDLSNWTPVNSTSFRTIFHNTGIDVANYDAILISWANQNLVDGVEFGANGLEYCKGKLARQNLITNQSFIITGDSEEAGCVLPTPGGVSGVKLWLKANDGVYSDAGVTLNTANGTGVQQWNDVSATGNHHLNTGVSTVKPTYNTSAFNFNPSLTFDGGDWLEKTSPAGYATGNADRVMIAVASISINNSTFDLVYDYGNSSGHRSLIGAASNNRIFTADGEPATDVFGANNSFAKDEQLILSAHRVSSISSVLKNNVVASTDNTAWSTVNPPGVGRLGKDAINQNEYWNGDIAEMIIYPSNITASVNQVYSYLALKYGITLTGQDYLASDGTDKIWDFSAATTNYDEDVFGIGKDEGSDLHQRISKSVNSGTILTVSTSSDFTSSNQTGTRTDIAADKSFLVFSNNGGGNTLITSELPTGSSATTRVEREWQLQKENWSQTVHLKFDGYNADWHLYRATNATFTAGVSDLGALNAQGEISVSNANLVEGEFYTLAAELKGPGGVLGASVWLKADDGVTHSGDGSNVTAWNDKSQTGYNFTDPTALKYVYRASAINFNPSIDNPDRADRRLENATSIDLRTVHLVVYPTNLASLSCGNPFSEIGSDDEGIRPCQAGPGWQIPGNGSDFTSGSGSSKGWLNGNLGTNPAVLETPQILSVENVSSTTISNGIEIGDGQHGRRWLGHISEIIGYNSVHSGTNRERIESYLALKYGITLDNSGGGTSGDYLLSNGNTIWDASNQSGYQNQVIGIYRDDDSDINQKQSKTPDDSLRVYVGSLAANNQANATSINNNLSSIIIGHNGAAYQAEYSGPNVPANTQKPGSIYARFERQWKVTNTNFSNTYSLRFQWDEVNSINVADLRLLVDTDTDFSNADVIASGENGITISEGSIIISGMGSSVIPMNSTRFITIGTVSSSTPLPVSLTSFKAEKQGENNAALYWETSSEINNSHFIVERKFENGEFEFLRRVEGNGTTNELNSYSEFDAELKPGNYFYRLVQVDFDGKREYYDIKQVVIEPQEKSNLVKYKIYPNPASTILNIESEVQGQHYITIYDHLGKTIHKTLNRLFPNTTEQLDVSRLENGLYYIQINEEFKRFEIMR